MFELSPKHTGGHLILLEPVEIPAYLIHRYSLTRENHHTKLTLWSWILASDTLAHLLHKWEVPYVTVTIGRTLESGQMLTEMVLKDLTVKSAGFTEAWELKDPIEFQVVLQEL